MNDLIERLDAATEGSRELDRQVARLSGWRDVEDAGGVLWWYPPGKSDHAMLPHYTTSIDAALTLVPEGWGDGLLEWGPGWALGSLNVHGLQVNTVRDGTMVNGKAATPALALCIASLKAREVDTQSDAA